MVSIKLKILLSSFILCIIAFLCSCGAGDRDILSEVDMKKDLSVQIVYRQNSYKSTVSYRAGVLYLCLIPADTYPDGLLYSVSSSEIVINYGDISKTYSYDAFPDNFVPKIIYGFFSSCGERFSMEKQTSDGGRVERRINGNTVCFLESTENGKHKYYMEIK